MMLTILIRNLIFTLVLLATGCESMAKRAEVDVSIENKSSQTIEDVRARFGDYACSWGKVGPTFKAIYGLYPHPITPEAELHWQVDGKANLKRFNLTTIYTPGKSGRLTFTVYDDRVEVTFREKMPNP